MASSKPGIRRAKHANSWYDGDANTLSSQLDQFLQKASLTDTSARAVISPHAGYFYSGQSAAYAYINLNPQRIKRIFILGPSHKEYLTKCALSQMDEYETPLGNIKLDKEVITSLYSTGAFSWMSQKVDENEHSIEMQLPYIVKMMKNTPFTLVPVLVGSLSNESEEQYAEIFAKYMLDESNFFIISSDFCHWGKERFDYTYYEADYGPIYKSIEALDKRGMTVIESQNVSDWYQYNKKYKNTICGRHPIGLLLQILNKCKLSSKLTFVHYAQSNQVTSPDDHSVSYAVAVLLIEKN